jgi:hypothetical protein
MDWETIVYTLLFILVALNAVVFFAENYVYVDRNADGVPELFRFNQFSQGDSYGYDDLNALHVSTNPDLSSIVQDEAPDNIWSIASKGFGAFWGFLKQLYNLTVGYQQIITPLFNPLNTSSTCSTQPLQSGCVGTGLATILNTILMIPIIIGIIYFIKFILQTVGVAK